ncbi:hypothetical protein ACFXJO_03795 [Streptomyces lavendulae]|uniref:hypothetical protein n=1 Tax=Streptomyces lavendulae TaxID=1914 RepID=UPI0036BCD46B
MTSLLAAIDEAAADGLTGELLAFERIVVLYSAAEFPRQEHPLPRHDHPRS